MAKKAKILFLCTGNPARGGMAEGFLRRLSEDAFIAASAGVKSEPIDPLAIDVMKEAGVDISTQHSKSTSEALHEYFAGVVAISDQTKERSPVFPFTVRIWRWSVEDPDDQRASANERLRRFRGVRDKIEQKVREFLHDASDLWQEPGRSRL